MNDLQKISSQHRKKLLPILTNDLYILFSSKEMIRNNDVTYKFRQSSNFLYLTGIAEIDYGLIFNKNKKECVLIIPDLDETFQVWVGSQLTKIEAKNIFKITKVIYKNELKSYLDKNLNKKYKIYTNLKKEIPFNFKEKTIYYNFDQVTASLRIIKSPTEIKFLKKSNFISKNAYLSLFDNCRKFKYEYEYQGFLEYKFREKGVPFNAYDTIVASGKNASVLHYIYNDKLIKKNDLILIDGGCEYLGYASDITRTFPQSGKFSSTQKKIYEIVLATQKKCIDFIKPGVSSIDLHKLSCFELLKGLIKLGMFKTSDLNELYENEIYKFFYPHGIGHLLGLDVHDIGSIKKISKKGLRSLVIFQPGMVFTVEPGIYFSEIYFRKNNRIKKYDKWINNKTVGKYKDVGGIRIEDDILVTKGGSQNLTSVPKEISELEMLLK